MNVLCVGGVSKYIYSKNIILIYGMKEWNPLCWNIFLKEKREDFNTLSPSIYGIWYFNIFILL